MKQGFDFKVLLPWFYHMLQNNIQNNICCNYFFALHSCLVFVRHRDSGKTWRDSSHKRARAQARVEC